MFLSDKSYAAVSSHECDVTKVESGSDSLMVFVENCEVRPGPNTTMSQGNASTDDISGPQTYLWFAQSSVDV
ncbi:hypothetical protein [Pseudoalteromonas luteoviolacea]|uniref:hypothetical protein n=1 Tax=Pseudoalteromonas luteoviolacea TaxID=43657 RepID=UPI00114F7499|nr:hypothetical protein [Pseudoalteromonas luteoviolacea]TQF70144.1 hypothetical protein FLM44_03355 [Pseudoalteromonas luteoviolacea]